MSSYSYFKQLVYKDVYRLWAHHSSHTSVPNWCFHHLVSYPYQSMSIVSLTTMNYKNTQPNIGVKAHILEYVPLGTYHRGICVNVNNMKYHPWYACHQLVFFCSCFDEVPFECNIDHGLDWVILCRAKTVCLWRVLQRLRRSQVLMLNASVKACATKRASNARHRVAGAYLWTINKTVATCVLPSQHIDGTAACHSCRPA